LAPWPAGGRRDRVGHRVPGHWAGMAGAWAYPAGRTTEAGTSSANAAPPGFRDPGRVPPNGRSLPLLGYRRPELINQCLQGVNHERKHYRAAPYPRERLPYKFDFDVVITAHGLTPRISNSKHFPFLRADSTRITFIKPAS